VVNVLARRRKGSRQAVLSGAGLDFRRVRSSTVVDNDGPDYRQLCYRFFAGLVNSVGAAPPNVP